MKTKTNKTTKTPKIRNRVIFSLCTYDIRTAADQSNGLLTDDCVKDILPNTMLRAPLPRSPPRRLRRFLPTMTRTTASNTIDLSVDIFKPN